MNVVHINSERTWSGGEVQTGHLIRGLQARGCTNVLIAPPKSQIARRMGEAGIEIVEVAMRGEGDVLAVARIAKILRRRKPDIVQLHTSHAHTLGLLAGKLAGARHIVATRRMDHAIKGPFSRFKYRGVDRIVAISEAIGTFVVEGGVPPEKVRIIHSVVQCPDPYPQGDLRSSFGIGPDAPVIGIVATLAERKGHRHLFEAVRQIKSKYPKICVLVVGEGPQKEELRELAIRIGLDKTVIFTGFRQDIPQVLNTLDVFVLASHREGLGVALLEAACSGRAIIGSNVGGIPEIVKDGETGLLVPPADAKALAEKLTYLLDHPEHAQRLGSHARAFVKEKFSLESMVRGYVELYEELLAAD